MKNSSSLFSLHPEEEDFPEKRKRVVTLFFLFGIACNVLLFVSKIIVGFLMRSIAIQSDAVNNLADAASAGVSMIAVYLAARRPDPDHPFGHGRIEYLAGLLTSLLIIFTGFELCVESVRKIVSPQTETHAFFLPTVVVLSVSVVVKTLMFLVDRKFGRMTQSPPLITAGFDALSDAGATLAVLLATLITHFFSFPRADGICGLLVSVLILFTGVSSAKETVYSLIGPKPDPELKQKISAIVLSEPIIQDVHDIVIHDYGPGHTMATIHAEVPQDEDLVTVHDALNRAEIAIAKALRCEAVIHADPCDTKSPESLAIKKDLEQILCSISPNLSMHDLHIQKKKRFTTLSFDVSRPYRFPISDDELCQTIQRQMLTLHPNHFCVIQIDIE